MLVYLQNRHSKMLVLNEQTLIIKIAAVVTFG